MSKVPFTKADVVRTIESAKAAGVTVHVVEVVIPLTEALRLLEAALKEAAESKATEAV